MNGNKIRIGTGLLDLTIYMCAAKRCKNALLQLVYVEIEENKQHVTVEYIYTIR